MKKIDVTLYLVTGRYDYDEKHFLEIVERACQHGVTTVQLREKELSSRQYLELAAKVKQITDRHQLPLIIDDRVDIALAIDASGVHIGTDDLPVSTARKLMGPDKIVGATAKTVPQALATEQDGADYLGVGAIYPTTTKVKTRITEVSTLDAICNAVKIPVAAIGGLNAKNLTVLEHSPIAGICVVSAIMKAADTAAAVRSLADSITRIKEGIR